MNKIPHLVMLILGISVGRAISEEKPWPELPKTKLTYKNLGTKSVKNVKTESIEINRGTNRIAQVRKIDRDGDGKFEGYIFSAFVSGNRVVVLTRMRSVIESSSFYGFDNVMVVKDLEFPEISATVLVVASRKHDWLEIFERNADGCYWPAGGKTADVVNSFFKDGAELIAPIVNELKQQEPVKNQ